MPEAKEKLIALVKMIVSNYWEQHKQPLLLSNLAPLIAASDGSYKDTMGTSLKRFATDTTSVDGYKIIQHPKQLARVGLIPTSQEYDFQQDYDDSRLTKSADQFSGGTLTKSNDGIALIQILSKLPKSDLEKIIIPVSVFVKLF